MPYLEYEHQLRAIGPGVLTIGSGPEAGWRILGRDLTSVHALLTPHRDGRALIMRGAPEATIYVNGTKVEGARAELSLGDTVRLGMAEFVYRHADGQTSGREGYLRDVRRARLFELREVTQIGRDPRCEVLLPEPNISRFHAEVRFDGTRFVVEPLGTADTVLNGRRLAEVTELHEGDELAVGGNVLRFTTEVPRNVRRAEPPNPIVTRRAARMPTVMMGAYQAREQMRQHDQRKLAAIAAGTVIAVAVIGLLLAR